MGKVKPSSYKVGKRRKAAEEVCWSLVLMMTFEEQARPLLPAMQDWIEESMSKWEDLAVETGVMKA